MNAAAFRGRYENGSYDVRRFDTSEPDGDEAATVTAR